MSRDWRDSKRAELSRRVGKTSAGLQKARARVCWAFSVRGVRGLCGDQSRGQELWQGGCSRGPGCMMGRGRSDWIRDGFGAGLGFAGGC